MSFSFSVNYKKYLMFYFSNKLKNLNESQDESYSYFNAV